MLIRLCENPECRQPAAYGAWCIECAATPNEAESSLPFIEWDAAWDDDTMDCG